MRLPYIFHLTFSHNPSISFTEYISINSTLKDIEDKVLKSKILTHIPNIKIISFQYSFALKPINFISMSNEQLSLPLELYVQPNREIHCFIKIENPLKEIKFKAITSYSFYESSSKFVRVELKVPLIDQIDPKLVTVDFQKRSLDIQILPDNKFIMTPLRFRVMKTHDKYIPEMCSFNFKKGKLVLKMRKKNENSKFFSLYKQKMVGENLDSDSD